MSQNETPKPNPAPMTNHHNRLNIEWFLYRFFRSDRAARRTPEPAATAFMAILNILSPYFPTPEESKKVEQALRTPGALLFRPGHVAISLGDGRTIEAKGSKYGVGIFSAHNRGWTTGGLIPGMRY